jgi:hypothetical protein
LTRILEINKKQKKWDSDAVDITNTKGFMILVLIAGIVLLIAFTAYSLTQNPWIARIIIADAAVIILPFWVTGTRSILTNSRLIIKTGMFLDLAHTFDRLKQEGEELQFQLRTAKEKGTEEEIPNDVKAIIMFHGKNPDFLGVQMQICLNNVQGTDYPYFYCVIVAREPFGKISEDDLHHPPGKIIIETKKQKDVYIAIIRQHTTKRTGYHTRPGTVRTIFTYALREARQLLEERA